MSKARDLADLAKNANDRLDDLATSDGALSNRNLIINGAMQVAQRGTSFTTQASSAYAMDRWINEHDASTFNLDIEQDWTSSPYDEGFPYSLKATVQTTATLSATGYIIPFEQRIEYDNTRHLAFGTSKAKSLVLSFWIKSNRTGSYTVDMTKGGPTKTVIMPYTINSADVWEKKSLAIPPDAVDTISGTVTLFWWMIAGSNYTSGTTQSEWAAQVAANRAVGCSNATTVGDYWQMTGVQLEVGDTATPFEHRSYGDELARCQRYYQRFEHNDSSNHFSLSMIGAYWTATQHYCCLPLCATMRANPTLQVSRVNALRVFGSGGSSSSTGIVLDIEGATMMEIRVDSARTESAVFVRINDTNDYLALDAEL